MNAGEVLEGTLMDGVNIFLTPEKDLRLQGYRVMVHKWLPIIRDKKPDILKIIEANAKEIQEAFEQGQEERAAIMEYDGELTREKAETAARAFRQFYAHLMGIGKETNCCYAPVGRYCAEGLHLRDMYYGACS